MKRVVNCSALRNYVKNGSWPHNYVPADPRLRHEQENPLLPALSPRGSVLLHKLPQKATSSCSEITFTMSAYGSHCEHVSGLPPSRKGHQERGWAQQHIWGLDIDRHVMTKMLARRFGPQGYALDLVAGDLYKVWAPSEISKVSGEGMGTP